MLLHLAVKKNIFTVTPLNGCEFVMVASVIIVIDSYCPVLNQYSELGWPVDEIIPQLRRLFLG